MRIRLSPAQVSALECSGLDVLPLTPAEAVLKAAWQGSHLIVTADTRDALFEALNDRSNAEDYQAWAAPTIVETQYARRASRSLGAVASKVIRS